MTRVNGIGMLEQTMKRLALSRLFRSVICTVVMAMITMLGLTGTLAGPAAVQAVGTDGKYLIEVSPQQAKPLSFDAAEYVNEEYGFSVKYPSSWIGQKEGSNAPEGALFIAEAPKSEIDTPSLRTSASALSPRGLIVAATQSLGSNDDLKAPLFRLLKAYGYIQSPYFSTQSSSAATLPDGTPAMQLVFHVLYRNRYNAVGLCQGVLKGDKWILVTIVTLLSDPGVGSISRYDGPLFSEIVNSLEFRSDFEYLIFDQSVDAVSLRDAVVVRKMTIKNNILQEMNSIGWSLMSPGRSLTVTKAYDDEGDIRFDHLVGPPIPPGQPDTDTVRFYFRKPLRAGETYNFTVEFVTNATAESDMVRSVCGSKVICREVILKVIAPRGYSIYQTEPANTVRDKTMEGREITILQAENVKSLELVAHFTKSLGPTAIGSEPTQAKNREQESLPAKIGSVARSLTSLPPSALIAIYAALGIAAGLVAFFFIFRFQKKRRAEAFIKTKEAYEKKLAQWEKEGYDVDEYKKKWFKEH
jgi:hypothetical protein